MRTYEGPTIKEYEFFQRLYRHEFNTLVIRREDKADALEYRGYALCDSIGIDEIEAIITTDDEELLLRCIALPGVDSIYRRIEYNGVYPSMRALAKIIKRDYQKIGQHGAYVIQQLAVRV